MASKSSGGSGWPQVSFVALAVLAVGLVLLWPYLGRNRPPPPPYPSAGMEPIRTGMDELIQAAAEAAQASVSGRWEVIVDRARVAAADGPDRLRIFVWTLFTAFDAMETEEQQGALRAFFETGRDVRFGEVFTVGSGGWLMDWPTLRVALFEYVAQRDSALAREIAIQLLQSRPDEPGEWALGLRELVRDQPASQWSSLVRVRIQEFIHDREWGARGAASWVEGFDVVVASAMPDYLEDMARISGGGASRTVRFVAFLTANRLLVTAPSACLAVLNQRPELFSDATGVRAGLFARADVRDPAQLAELERYFLRSDVGPGERAQFAAAFPFFSAAPTFRLLTQPMVRSDADVGAVRAAALGHLQTWGAADQFPEWRATFREIRQRLEKGAPEAVPANG